MLASAPAAPSQTGVASCGGANQPQNAERERKRMRPRQSTVLACVADMGRVLAANVITARTLRCR
jgi:hypothetical protein